MYAGAPLRENLKRANYYAPRGRKRLFEIGKELSNRYVYPNDLLIGIIGSEGSGKSTLIRGLFPGLELTNDDEGANLKVAPIFEFDADDFFCPHTFHLDIRYELAFHQLHEIVDSISDALDHGRRVIVEHFDLVYEKLGYNAQLIFSIGEEISIYRPTIFGPTPTKIKEKVDLGNKYRLMAHSAEDIVGSLLIGKYNYQPHVLHSDVKHGFIIEFDEKPDIDISVLEKEALEIIEKDLPIKPGKGDFISIDKNQVICTGKRIHVKTTGEIENFRLLKEYRYDPINKKYLLVGVVGREEINGLWEDPCA